MSNTLFSLGLGIGTKNSIGNWLEVYYPQPLLNPSVDVIEAITSSVDYQGGNAVIELTPDIWSSIASKLQSIDTELTAKVAPFKASTQPTVATILATDEAPTSVPEGYLKLQLLSHRLVKPHHVNLDGLFSVLPNVAWTNRGAIDINELPQRQIEARLQGEVIDVMSIDKFPKMTNYVIPSGVRIADTSRVRLGAYLGEGTTIMHEGFVNFNAGTEGTSMVEGRISAGVMIGEGSDLGGGCSTMGTLSGGNNVIISIGKECLVGANAGVGIPLGDRCTIEAGLYVTAGSVVTVLDDAGTAVNKVKARDLAGEANLLFRRNSVTGAIECKTNKSAIELNEALHANN